MIESCTTYHNTVEYEAKESVVYKVAPSPKIQLYKMSDSEDIGKDLCYNIATVSIKGRRDYRSRRNRDLPVW